MKSSSAPVVGCKKAETEEGLHAVKLHAVRLEEAGQREQNAQINRAIAGSAVL